MPVRAHLGTWSACACFLAQSPEAVGEATQRVLWSVLAILVGVAVLVVIGLVVRRLVLGTADTEPTRGFTLEQMRRMHERGELTEAEWTAARDALLAQGRRVAADVQTPRSAWTETSGEDTDQRQPAEGRTDAADAPHASQLETEPNPDAEPSPEAGSGRDGGNETSAPDRPGGDADDDQPPTAPDSAEPPPGPPSPHGRR